MSSYFPESQKVAKSATSAVVSVSKSVVPAILASLVVGAALGALERQKVIPDDVAANPAFDAMYRALPLTIMISVLVATGAHRLFDDSVRKGNAVWKHLGMMGGLFVAISLVLGVTSYVSNKLPEYLRRQSSSISKKLCDAEKSALEAKLAKFNTEVKGELGIPAEEGDVAVVSDQVKVDGAPAQ